jgi:hypothetical protein
LNTMWPCRSRRTSASASAGCASVPVATEMAEVATGTEAMA